MTESKSNSKAIPKTVTDLSQIKPGQLIRVHLKIKETNTKGEEKERIQIFEGIVLDKSGATPASRTIVVRKESHGVGVERIFPLSSPVISQIEVVKTYRVRRAKLFHLRKYNKKLHEVATKK
ncbi:MAG: 50S ribosomal protein L19 [Patescibacteria group bacterium]